MIKLRRGSFIQENTAKMCVTTLGVPETPVAPSVPETVSARADLAGATGPGVDPTAVATRKRPGVANRQLSPMAPRVLPAQVTGLASAIPAGVMTDTPDDIARNARLVRIRVRDCDPVLNARHLMTHLC